MRMMSHQWVQRPSHGARERFEREEARSCPEDQALGNDVESVRRRHPGGGERGGSDLYEVNDGKSGYLSMSLQPLYFGLGETESVHRIDLYWPSGKTQTLEGPVAANQTLEIQEP